MKTGKPHPVRCIRSVCLLLALSASVIPASAKIRNGYEVEIVQLRNALVSLKIAREMDPHMRTSARRYLAAKVADIENKITCYELTAVLIEQFKAVAPDMYAAIDTIKDKKGRAVDVYVKFIVTPYYVKVPWGMTYISQADGDPDASLSEYGLNTVSIKISTPRYSLQILSHELGHVKYQVPNIASYVSYYKRHYGKGDDLNRLGHNYSDQSGKQAMEFESAFKKHLAAYKKLSSNEIKSVFDLMRTRKRDVSGDFGSSILVSKKN